MVQSRRIPSGLDPDSESGMQLTRDAGVEHMLLDRGAQLHACPLEYSGQRVTLFDPGIHTATGPRLRHVGGRLVKFTLPAERDVEKPSLPFDVWPRMTAAVIYGETQALSASQTTVIHSCTKKVAYSSSKGR